MNWKIILAAFGILLSATLAGQADHVFFSETGRFFNTHVKDGLVDYDSAQKSKALPSLIDKIGQATVEQWDEEATIAFYINAYNLLIIDAVLAEYPVNSVMDIEGFFNQKKHLVAGKSITLDQLEKELLFGIEQDARFHFALVCGAKGCPPIAPFAFTPENLEEQLSRQTRSALNHPQFIRVFGKNVELSQIFEWYTKDFGQDTEEILSFINEFRDNPIPVQARAGYYPYDWSLNEY